MPGLEEYESWRMLVQKLDDPSFKHGLAALELLSRSTSLSVAICKMVILTVFISWVLGKRICRYTVDWTDDGYYAFNRKA